ncbi:helix-turn-helix domain-containing protein [Amycolatopsis sp. H20-H5]|uniref:helix-turn-helix domain-containing protein n=1 Tax=Amycolatopsis sp. H20-H5 TaxID=3046309 RepID=UPI002DB6C7BB|nr:helix-turn-helix transcriptional regulator [Amycolatopsis sp. H20-H5]MEC3975104.1 helix-turn-helix transcriptional regulator [Amycolatopsis sp. H20-H5]
MPAVNHPRLVDRRDELDLSNPELADRMGISKGYLENILYGVDEPSMRVIHRFTRVLGLGLHEVRRTPDGDPSGPPKQPPTSPAGPPKRGTTEKKTGPRRAAGAVA